MRAAKSFVISKEDQHLHIAPLHLLRELAPAEFQDCRKDEEEKSQDLNRQRRVREDNPYTIFSMKQSHRALEHLFFLSIHLSLLLLSTSLVFAFSMFLQSHPETPHTEVMKSKGCILTTGILWTEEYNSKDHQLLYLGPTCAQRAQVTGPCSCSGQAQSKSSYITKVIHDGADCSVLFCP